MRVAALALLTTPLAAQDAVTVLERAEKASDRLSSLQAEFVQTLDNPMLGNPVKSHGTLFLVPPDHFAMRFDQPEGDRLVADGTWLWAYTPSTVPGQVVRQSIPRDGALTPNLIAQFVDRPLDRYDASHVGVDSVGRAVVDLVRLVPRQVGYAFREAVIGVSRGDGLLRSISLIEDSGQRRSLVFVAIEVGVAIPDHELRFEPPSGVKVVSLP